MKFTIRCIGKERDKLIIDWCNDYIKRLPWKISFEELPQSQKKNVQEIKSDEANSLLNKDYSNAYLIALDETGKEMDSNTFAQDLEKISLTHKEIIFFIGGAAGLCKDLKKNCNSIISLSKMTMPHKMVRLFIIEQLYRAHTIQNNHPYHK